MFGERKLLSKRKLTPWEDTKRYCNGKIETEDQFFFVETAKQTHPLTFSEDIFAWTVPAFSSEIA